MVKEKSINTFIYHKIRQQFLDFTEIARLTDHTFAPKNTKDFDQKRV